MSGHWRAMAAIVAAGGLVAGVAALRAQAQDPPPRLPTEITAIRFNAGQSVVPYFEGWIRTADGGFDMVFGYFNRNYQQELAVPPGPNNKVEPGPVDSGQPTYFLPRRHRFVYRVRVPADFGKKEVVWTITANGRTERAFGNLIPAQEITERVVSTNGNFNPGYNDPNKAPTIDVAAPASVAAGAPVTLTTSVADDGLPKPRVVAAPKPAPNAGGFGAQVNTSSGGRPRGLTVSWLQFRGPAKVAFEPGGSIPVVNGKAATTARFAAPGIYKLIASADDGALSSKAEVTVAVGGPTP